MKNFVRTALLAATLAGASFWRFRRRCPQSSPSRPGSYCPAPETDKRSDYPDKKLHQQLETDVSQISMKGIKDGALIEVIKSGKWDDAAVKQQLAAFSNIEQQARYYRVKYYLI
ncbi:putative secreted protein [Salmonella enterica subsp. arizonae]|nr:putative secreted protein [Salmonella enterica subsp. arizonae]